MIATDKQVSGNLSTAGSIQEIQGARRGKILQNAKPTRRVSNFHNVIYSRLDIFTSPSLNDWYLKS